MLRRASLSHDLIQDLLKDLPDSLISIGIQPSWAGTGLPALSSAT